jgi:formate hydrogenlyase subunit 4
MEMSAAVKQVLLMALVINLIVPVGIATTLSVTAIAVAVGLFMVKGSILALGIGLFESSMAKMRFFRLPGLFIMAFFFSTLVIIVEVFT